MGTVRRSGVCWFSLGRLQVATAAITSNYRRFVRVEIYWAFTFHSRSRRINGPSSLPVNWRDDMKPAISVDADTFLDFSIIKLNRRFADSTGKLDHAEYE